jgi:hypothetical protein
MAGIFRSDVPQSLRSIPGYGAAALHPRTVPVTNRCPRDPDTYFFAVRELFPHVSEDNDVVGRLVLLTMLAGTLRLDAHPTLTRR